MAKPMIEPKKVIGQKTQLCDVPFTSKDAVIYALGIGYSQDPYDAKDMQYTYEMSDPFQVHPTITSLWSTFNPFEVILSTPGFPSFNPMMLLHGEQRTEVFKPIDCSQKYANQAEIADVADKGKGALISFLIKTFEKKEDGTLGDLALTNTMSLFVRGLGGFGYKGTDSDPIPALPKSQPTKVIVQKTIPNQAFIYRLSGDINPLHVDPGMAEAGGFEKPILHGLCTYGIAAKLIIQNYCDNDASRFRWIKSRFTSHVFPGETLEFRTWLEGTTVIFEAITQERERKPVIVGFASIIPAQKL